MMSKIISIYCCGGVKKGPEDKDKIVWGEQEYATIAKVLTPTKVVFLSPNIRQDDITSSFTVFGRDHFQVSTSDFLVMDGRQKRGIGIGIELVSAKYFNKPVIAVCPPNSHFRRTDLEYLGGKVKEYIHPHLEALADVIVDDFKQAALWMKGFVANPTSVKTIQVLDQGIAEYKKTQLQKDLPMQEALELLKKFK